MPRSSSHYGSFLIFKGGFATSVLIWLHKNFGDLASELYIPSDSWLSAKLVQTFPDRSCHVVSMTDSHGHILGLLYRLYMDMFVVIVNQI
jgi:hypothetical protein